MPFELLTCRLPETLNRLFISSTHVLNRKAVIWRYREGINEGAQKESIMGNAVSELQRQTPGDGRHVQGVTRSLPGDCMKPTVFIVDDDASVRKSLSRLLDSRGVRTETFASADEFLKREYYEGIGCIVLDVLMPGLSGMDLQDELAKANDSMPIVFITDHGSIPMSVRAMKQGAVDFLLKPVDENELLDAVRSALEKDRHAKSERAAACAIRRRMEHLTPREYETFRYVITGMTNKQIACRLGIAEKTVKIHRGQVFQKLCGGSIVELVLMAKKVGIEPLADTRFVANSQ